MSIEITQTSITSNYIKGNISDSTIDFSNTTALSELTTGDSAKNLFGKLKLAVENLITVTNKQNNFSNIKLSLTGGDAELNSQLYNKWATIPIGEGMIRVANGKTVCAGTYIKYDAQNGSMTFSEAGGRLWIWRINNGTYYINYMEPNAIDQINSNLYLRMFENTSYCLKLYDVKGMVTAGQTTHLGDIQSFDGYTFVAGFPNAIASVELNANILSGHIYVTSNAYSGTVTVQVLGVYNRIT